MAVLTAQGIASTAIPLLVRQLVLARTVSIVPSDEFGGPNGETITVRVPQPGSHRIQASRNDLLVADDVYEAPVDVTMRHVYHLKNVTDQELTFDLENFARQITRVQAEAVANGAEQQLTDVMNSLVADATIDGTNPDQAILAARTFLGENDAPAGDRYLAVGPTAAAVLLSHDKFVKVNESGSPSALRDAVIGRLYGFTVVESNNLDTNRAVAYHRSGFVWANRIPRPARGAGSSATAAAQGVGLRQVFQYDASRARDQSLLSTFSGAAAVYDWEFDESGEPESGDVRRRFAVVDLES